MCSHGPTDAGDSLSGTPEWVHGILLDHPSLLPVSSILKHDPCIDMMWHDWEGEATGTKSKRSMLQLAAEMQAAKCVQLLLDAGADARLASPSDGKTALHLACARKPSMASARVIAMLVQHGADRDAVDFNGNKPGDALERMSASMSDAASVGSVASAASDVSGHSSDVQRGQLGYQRQHATRLQCSTSPAKSATSAKSANSNPNPNPNPNHAHHARLASSKSALVTDVADLELMDGVDYGSAHFRMFHYKVDKCPHEDCIHDTEACPYVHPGDKSRRRNPGVVSYQPVPCPHFRKGNCRLGDACPLSHGVFECWLHPIKYRTQLCTTGSKCSRDLCFFAHSLDELREPFEDCEGCSMATCQIGCSNQLTCATETSIASSASNASSKGPASAGTPRSVCADLQAAGFNSATTSPEISSGISFTPSARSPSPTHDTPRVSLNDDWMDKKIATLQAAAVERERTRRESAVAGIAETLKSMAVSRNATLHGCAGNPGGSCHHSHGHGHNHNHNHNQGREPSLYKRTSVQDAASVLSIPSSDSSVSLALGSSPSRSMDLFSAFA